MAASDWDASSEEDNKPATKPVATLKSKFADEDASDSDVKDDWDASDSEDETEKKPAAPVKLAPIRQKGITKQKIAEREAAEKARLQEIVDRNLETAEDRKAREQAAILRSDMESAAALLGGTALNDTDSLLSTTCKTKPEFEALAGNLAEALIRKHGNLPLYSAFVEAIVRQLVDPMKDVDVRKISSTLNSVANEKQKAAKDGKKKKSAKPTLGTGGSKTTSQLYTDTRSYHEALDDDFDDFM